MKTKTKRKYLVMIITAAAVMVLDLGICLGTGLFRQSSRPSMGESGEWPSFAEGEMPSFENGEMPSFAEGEMPSFENGEMPSFAEGEMPSFGEGEMPSSENEVEASSEEGEQDSSRRRERPSFADGERPSFEGMNRQSGKSKLVPRIAAGAVFAAALAVMIWGLLGLRRLKKGVSDEQSSEDTNAADPIEETRKAPDIVEKRLRKTRRKRIGYGVLVALLMVGVLILQSLSNSVAEKTGASVEERVLSGTAETGDIERSLNSYGILASASEEDVNIPGSIRVKEYKVRVGDTVKEGDPIAAVEKSSVLAAIADLQDMIDELDKEADEIADDSISSSLTATAYGTVVKVYAQTGKSVVDTMYEHGALMLISLDGLLAVQVENTGNLRVGDTVEVSGKSSGSCEGRVSDVEKDTVTITVSLDDMGFGEKVSVKDDESTKLGSGKLYIYSQQKITGYSGTVSSVYVGSGDSVATGNTLLTLSDTDYSADYDTLLKKREKLVAQMNRLLEVSRTGCIYAEKDGVIASLNTEIASLDSGTQTASTSAAGTSAAPVTATAPATAASPAVATTSTGGSIRTETVLYTVYSTAYRTEVTEAVSDTPADSVDSKEEEKTETTADKSAAAGDDGDDSAGSGNESGSGDSGSEGGSDDGNNESGGGQGSDETGGGGDSGSSGSGSDPGSSEGGSEQGSGEQGSGEQGTDDPEPADPDQVVGRALAMIWLDQGGSTLKEGVPESVTLILSANGEDIREETLSDENDWKISFSDLPMCGEDGQEISYELRLKDQLPGFTAQTVTQGDVVTLIMIKSSQSPSGPGGDSGMPGEGDNPVNPGGQGGKPGGFPSGFGSKAGSGKFSINMASLSSSGQLTTQGATIADAYAEPDPTYVFSETTLCTMTPNDKVSVDISVDELDIGSIVIGSQAQISLDALSGRLYEGTITALDPFGTNSGGNTKYTVTVSMDKEENMLLGMNASVKINLGNFSGVLLLPEAAVTETNGKTYIYTEYDEKTDEMGGLTEVTLGQADGENAEVLSGIDSGQTYYYRYAGTITYTFKKTEDNTKTEEE